MLGHASSDANRTGTPERSDQSNAAQSEGSVSLRSETQNVSESEQDSFIPTTVAAQAEHDSRHGNGTMNGQSRRRSTRMRQTRKVNYADDIADTDSSESDEKTYHEDSSTGDDDHHEDELEEEEEFTDASDAVILVSDGERDCGLTVPRVSISR